MRRAIFVILAILALIVPAIATFHGVVSSGDPTSGVLPAYDDVYANWKNAGLLNAPQGSIDTVDAARTNCTTGQAGETMPLAATGITPPASGDDYVKITQAIANCPAGTIIQLAAGTFKIDQSEGPITIGKGVTLRGNGTCSNSSTPASQTNVYCPTEILVPNGGIFFQGGRTCGSPNTGCTGISTFLLGASGQWGSCTYDNTASSSCATALDADAAQGATTVQVHSLSPFSVGMWVRIDEQAHGQYLTDPMGQGQIWATSDFLSSSGSPATNRVAYSKFNPTCCNADIDPTTDPATNGSWWCAYSWYCDRVNAEIHVIKSLGAGPCPGANCTLTFDDPLTIAMRTSGGHAGLVYNPTPAFAQYAGLENLSIYRPAGAAVTIEFCAYCWMRNVEARGWEADGVVLSSAVRAQIDTSFIADAYSSCNNGDEYPITIDNGSTEVLIVNSITRFGGKGMTGRAGGAGSVIAYNYMDDQAYMACIGPTWLDTGLNASHFTGAHSVLFEGNWTSNMDNEMTHGNSVYHVYFRNFSGGYRTAFVDPVTSSTVNDFANQVVGSQNGVLRATGPQAYSYWYGYVGNVMGFPGYSTTANHWAYNCNYVESLYTYIGCIWMLGWSNFEQSVQDPNLNGGGYIFQHGNYDYVTPGIADWANGYSHTLPNSFYLTSEPSFFTAGSSCSYTWPPFNSQGSSDATRIPSASGTGCTSYSGLPAKARFDAGTPFVQP